MSTNSLIAMFEKLSPRDRRALIILAVFVLALAAFSGGSKWLDHWGSVRKSLAAAKAELEIVNPASEKQKGLLSIIPVFEMPQKEQEQKFLFREKFNEQLKKAGIKSDPLKFLPAVKSQAGDYKLLPMQCRSKGSFTQVMNLLARLKDNPYLVGIEQMRIKCDPKKRQEMELDLTVSTFVK